MKLSPEQIKEHYEIEKELASKLRQSTKEERKHLYSSLYDEMYRRTPLHPQLTRKKDTAEIQKRISSQMAFLNRFLNKDVVFAEVGSGDCALSFEVSKHVKKVYAIDVSEEITKSKQTPENFQLILSDGTSIPLPPESVNVVYSYQLMEHLHPSDAIEQLTNIKNALTKGGKYICLTPNRISGPHDISKHFDKEATGFHLKEYTFTDLNKLFKDIGFAKVAGYIGAKGMFLKTPLFVLFLLEGLINLLPRAIKRSNVLKPFLNIKIVGIK